MDANQIIGIIKRRRDWFLESHTNKEADNLPVYSEAGVARAIADEYDSLLEEIEGS
jgi:hypothetical protein